MLRRIALAFLIVSALLICQPAHASDLVYPGGGVLAQVVDGGGTQTTITLVNMDSLQSNYTLSFFGDDGSALILSTTAGPPSATLTGTLNPGASTIIKTNGGGSTQSQGWALLVPSQTAQDSQGLYHYTVAGSAVFSLVLPGNPVADASVPLDTGTDTTFALPFDHTTAVTGVALANTYQSTPLTVKVTFYDLNGTTMFSDNIQLPGNGHTSFLLNGKYPQLAGLQGLAVFTGVPNDTNNRSGFLNVLGLRANLANTSLSTVTPIVPCYYNSNLGGCTN